MIPAARLAWLQLGREPLRLLVAIAGVAFAVILVFMPCSRAPWPSTAGCAATSSC